MQTAHLEFKFKGSRTYVHGTDMYNSILARLATMLPLNSIQSIKLTIHNQTSHQCDLLMPTSDNKAERPKMPVAEFEIRGAEGNVIGWLVERDADVVARYDYDEDGIVTSAQIEGREIRLVNGSIYTPIEVTVALNKALLLNVIDDPAIKWLFTRIDLNRPFDETDTPNLRIAFLNSLANHRLTRSAVYVGDEHLGHIYFSAVKK